MPAIFTKGDLETRFTKLEPFSGIHHDLLDDDSGYDNAICWRITRPNPAWVIALGGFIQTQGE